MKIFILSSLLLVYCFSHSQEFEIGPMFNYEATTLVIPDNSYFIVGEMGGQGTKSTGFETNFSIGVFAQYFLEERIAIAAELFYGKTTSTDLKDTEFTSVSFIPYSSMSLIKNSELYLNFGAGIAYMLKTPDFENEELNNKIRKIDVPFKIGLNYRFPKLFIIDVGIHNSFTKVVKDELFRTSYYVGVKMPLNQILDR